LSHTWGADEATYEEINQGSRAAVLDLKSGSAKIRKCCSQAVKDGIEWVWIDTCCIDKSSSAELSEAINSMFTWYLQAEVCYAYLEDVPTPAPVLDEETFARSRWFTRGWTLQELIAPPSVEFYAHDWTLIGTKRMLSNLVERITGIDAAVLAHERSLSSYSVAARIYGLTFFRGITARDDAERGRCLLPAWNFQRQHAAPLRRRLQGLRQATRRDLKTRGRLFDSRMDMPQQPTGNASRPQQYSLCLSPSPVQRRRRQTSESR
ncbi:hypothetical protein OQA88_6978, partial [Cercophora sp. LCS_1]